MNSIRFRRYKRDEFLCMPCERVLRTLSTKQGILVRCFERNNNRYAKTINIFQINLVTPSERRKEIGTQTSFTKCELCVEQTDLVVEPPLYCLEVKKFCGNIFQRCRERLRRYFKFKQEDEIECTAALKETVREESADTGSSQECGDEKDTGSAAVIPTTKGSKRNVEVEQVLLQKLPALANQTIDKRIRRKSIKSLARFYEMKADELKNGNFFSAS